MDTMKPFKNKSYKRSPEVLEWERFYNDKGQPILIDIESDKKVFFISDTHFFHSKVIEYSDRPFVDYKDMNEVLLTNWNETIGEDDVVFFLGDFICGYNMQHHQQVHSKHISHNLWNMLNGNKFFVMGNHDETRKLSSEIVRHKHMILTYKGKRIYLNHEPVMADKFKNEFQCHYHLFGHLHCNPFIEKSHRDSPNFIYSLDSRCVSVECIDYKPKLLDVILEEIDNGIF